MRVFLLFSLLYLIAACGPANESVSTEMAADTNPAAEGFNLADSDAQAIAIADSVMNAMGGRKNWDATRYIHWNFFGRRSLLWDKYTGRVRIEIPDSETVFLTNINTDEGKVKTGETIHTEADSLSKYLESAKSIWINDAYWLVMPFKLKDSGVTLKYMGQDSTLAGTMAHVLELTFENVGRTPDNKYLVYVDPETNLVTQWDFFRNAADPEPGFSSPWEDYKQYGNILLSGGRGPRGLTDIAVYDKVPDSVFDTFDAVDPALFE